MSGNVLKPLDHIVCSCVAVPARYLLTIIDFAHMTHNWIYCILSRFISKFFYSSLFFTIVEVTSSVGDEFVLASLQFVA